jgi:alkanesulfonate monooxygenase
MIGLDQEISAAPARLELIASIIDSFPRVKNPEPDRVANAARKAEAIGFDNVLIGYVSTRADSWMVAANVLFHTKTLRALVAQRPGMIPPTLLARTASTLDMLSEGRLALNLVAGGSAVEQAREGDFAGHDERYARAAECMDIAIRSWTEAEEFNHRGKYFRVENVIQDVKPIQRPYPPLYVGGASDVGREFATRYADVYMLWGEPLADTRVRIEQVRALARRMNRRAPRFSVSLRLVLGDTEQQAWDLARSLVPEDAAKRARDHSEIFEDAGRSRQLKLAQSNLVHDTRLWLGITAASGGHGATSALVGAPRQVLDALLEYVRLGVSCFQLSSPKGGLLIAPERFFDTLRSDANAILESLHAEQRKEPHAS